MSLIGTQNLLVLRSLQTQAMPQEATVTVPGEITVTDLAESVPGEPTSFTMPCRLTPASSTGEEASDSAGYTESEQRWEMAYPLTYTIPATASVKVDGTHFEVVTATKPDAYQSEHRVLLRLIGGS